VPSEDLCALYSLSAGLIFPSLDEGFGWPIIEAQACGCPIFASNLPPMTEVAADVAVFFDPADPVAAAAIILDALSLNPVKVAHGLREIKFFDGDRMVADYLSVYRHLTSAD
jgi:glycosyltransferase involved in cell wall biosynthesis